MLIGSLNFPIPQYFFQYYISPHNIFLYLPPPIFARPKHPILLNSGKRDKKLEIGGGVKDNNNNKVFSLPKLLDK